MQGLDSLLEQIQGESQMPEDPPKALEDGSKTPMHPAKM